MNAAIKPSVNPVVIEDYLCELRDTNAVLESYAQLAMRCPEQTIITLEQISGFMFMVYQQQQGIIDKLEQTLKRSA
jgi:hypothetical protein